MSNTDAEYRGTAARAPSRAAPPRRGVVVGRPGAGGAWGRSPSCEECAHVLLKRMRLLENRRMPGGRQPRELGLGNRARQPLGGLAKGPQLIPAAQHEGRGRNAG